MDTDEMLAVLEEVCNEVKLVYSSGEWSCEVLTEDWYWTCYPAPDMDNKPQIALELALEKALGGTR